MGESPTYERWIVVAYDLPNQPSKLRVRAWRNFKKLGALYPPVSLCILPDTPKIRKEIGLFRSEFKSHGTILVMSARASDAPDEGVLSRMLQEDRHRQYEEIYEECQEFLDEIALNFKKKKVTPEETDELEHAFESLQRWYRGIRGRGYERRHDVTKVSGIMETCKKALARFSERAQPSEVNT